MQTIVIQNPNLAGKNIPKKHLILEPRLQAEIRERVILNLFIVNLVIVTVSFVVSYLLAGKTLKPIKKAMEKQKNFIANASHELKTPIATIKIENEVALMDKTNTAKNFKKILKSNLEEINNLEKLVSKIIDQNKLDTNQQNKFEQVDLKKIVKEGINEFRKPANLKNILFDVSLENSNVLGNKEMLKNLVAILLDNAVKYTPANKQIEVNLKNKNKKSIIKVSNFGKKIEKQEITKIFERFYTVDKSHSSNGHGLGLSIAREIVELHQGTIQAKSTDNKTTFTVKI
jgi:signal transduction histidine kinase